METGSSRSSAYLLVAILMLLLVVFGGVMLFRIFAPPGGLVEDRHSTTSQLDPSATTLHGASAGDTERRLDRHWQRITAVLQRENPDGWIDRHPPASDEDIAFAEEAAGVEFPAELRWLLRQQNGQKSTIDAVFTNGDRLMGAVEIAGDYLMWRDIITDLDQVPAEDERPTKERSTSWWPGLLPFMTDVGGDSVFIDARTGYVYSDFESMVHPTDVSGKRLDAPLTFTAWMKDLAERLEAGRYHRDASTGPALWFWEKDPDE